MKRLIVLIFLLFTTFILPVSAQEPLPTSSGVEKIHRYDVDIDVRKDGTLDIHESIIYDFGHQQRHGIFRDIPYRYEMETDSGKKKFDMDIRVQSITDENSMEHLYGETRESGLLRLKIGDPNKTITGVHTYNIHYVVSGGMRYFQTHDELYWNAIGTGWDIDIDTANVNVSYPSDTDIPDTEYKFRCLTGEYGSANEQCEIHKVIAGKTRFEARNLYPYEGMTVVVSLPEGTVEKLYPQEYVSFFDTVLGKITVVLIVLGAIFWYAILPIWIAVRWFLYGRDPDVGPAVTSYFEGPKTLTGRELSPGEAGALLDEKVDRKDVLAVLVDLARRGHLKFVEKDAKDFYLERDERAGKTRKEGLEDLQDFESKLLLDLFKSGDSVRLKDAKLVTTVLEVEKRIYDGLVREEFFPTNPQNVRTKFGVLAGLGAITFNLPLAISSLLFGLQMPKKTIEGARAAQKAAGLRSFLKSQERQINFKEANPQVLFEKLLPFAVAFGVEKNWIEKFQDLNLKQPEWYVGQGTYSSAHMLSGMQSSFKSFNSAATPVSSSSGFSSGGGFSGGGGGGGGGGSW